VGTAQAEEDQLGVTLDLTYMSKWMTKGAEGYGQQAALFKTIDLDLYGTGFGVKVTHRNATASGYVDKQRFDYRPYYKSKLFEGEPLATNYNISCGYEHYTGLARDAANTTFEWIFAFSWPNLTPQGIVPNYIAHYEYPAGSGYTHHDVTGWVHRFGLGYDLTVIELPESPSIYPEKSPTETALVVKLRTTIGHTQPLVFQWDLKSTTNSFLFRVFTTRYQWTNQSIPIKT